MDSDPADLLEMRGEDRLRFLNGLVTAEVKGLEPGHGVYGFVTEVKGHILADVAILALDDRLWLELPPERGAAIAEHLGKYIIVDRVALERLEGRWRLALAGPKAPELLAGLAGAGPEEIRAHRELEIAGRSVRAVRGADLGVPVFGLWLAAEDVEAVREALAGAGAVTVSGSAFDALRVAAGRPRFGRDFGPDNFPKETGLEEEAVSYTKGCYLGQEVVARIHYRGGVNKNLRGVRLAADVAEILGREVVHDGRPAGTVTSAAGTSGGDTLGLAILHKRVEPGAAVEIDGAGEAEVVELPFAGS